MSHFSDSDWLPAITTSLNQINYGLDDSYLTPQLSYADPTSVCGTPEPMQRPQSGSGFYQSIEQPPKPRSSSSGMYQHQVPEFEFTSNPLGIKNEMDDEFTYTHPPPLPSNSGSPYYGGLDMSDINPNALKRQPIPIAPNPMGPRSISALKRTRDDESPLESLPKRRRNSSTGLGSIDLTDEERLLLQLKDEENLMWKDIALRFQIELGKNHQVPALQMRYKRLREKMRVWTDTDVHALEQARDYWEKFKWDIIATKMLDFGCGEKWPAKYCVRKWDELHPGMDLSREQLASIRGSPALSRRGTPEIGSRAGTPHLY